MSWAQQREQIRRAAGAGVRPRISALGSQILPLRGPGGQSAQLSRPNGALTRAGQYYYQLVGRQPPSRQFDEEQPLIREGPSDYVLLRSGVKKLVRTLAPDGNYHLTKLGKAFFRDKYTEWLAHVPVRIRGRRKNGRPYEREDYLPVTSLNVGLQRQNDGLSEAQVARNVKQAVLAKLGADDDFSTLLELSGEQYFLDNSREWTLSSQTTQVVDDRVVVETSLRQPLGALRREVSYQLWKGDEILESAFERRWDKLCVPRQLAELLKLPLAEVLSDFDTICDRGWQDRGMSPKEIREFCVWRGAPMFFVNCRGQLVDSYQPVEKEARAVAFAAWDGHAFFYKNARTVHLCDESERIQPRYRAERRDSTAPEFAQWLEWDGQLRAGHFWTRDLRKARADLLSEGHCPKVAMRSLCEWRGLRLRAGEADCIINELPEEAGDLQAWMQRLGLKYRGQRLASATSEAFMQLLKVQRELPQNREQILAAQGGLCKLCGAPVGLGTCEFDHVVPVHQAFRGQIQELQALCLECHRTKTALENSHATTLESRFSRRAYEAYVHSPRLPAGVRPAEVGPRQAVPRHRRGAVPQERAGQRPLPSSRFLSPGHHCGGEAGPSGGSHLRAPAEGQQDGASEQAALYVGEGWYAEPACAYMLPVVFGRHRPRGAELPGLGAAQDGGGLGRGGAPGQAERERPNRPVGPQRGPAVPHADQQ